MKTKKRYEGHSENCLEAHQGVGRNEGFTCTDNCLDKPTHTPTPWKVSTDLDNNYAAKIWSTQTKDTVGKGISRNDAEYIVRAVNAHQELVDALLSVRNEYRNYVLKDHNNLVDAKGSRILAQIDRAIAKAERR